MPDLLTEGIKAGHHHTYLAAYRTLMPASLSVYPLRPRIPRIPLRFSVPPPTLPRHCFYGSREMVYGAAIRIGTSRMDARTLDAQQGDLGAVVRAITARYDAATASGVWPTEPVWLSESRSQAAAAAAERRRRSPKQPNAGLKSSAAAPAHTAAVA